MSVDITVGSTSEEVGASSFLHAFFSTISVYCEPQGWGSRFPHLMNELYQGHLPAHSAAPALAELREAKAVLSQLPPSAVVWDIDNRSARPPWGNNIAETITNLGGYFVSSSGRDLFGVLDEILSLAVAKNLDATVE